MAAVPPAGVAAALAETAALGGFFAVTTGPRTGDWLPFDALLQPRQRIVATRSALATSARVEASGIAWRVAASTASLALFARLIAPFVGSLVTTGVLPDVTGETLWWQPVSGLLPLSLDPVAGRDGDATVFARVVLDGLISPLVDTYTREGVPPVIVIGNVASAIGGAAVMISTARPELAGAAWSLTAELLELPMLTGTAAITPTGLRRGSCCLFYRVPGGGFCGDCILADRGAFSR